MKDSIFQEDLSFLGYYIDGHKSLHGKSIFITGATGLVGSMIVKSIILANKEHGTAIKVIALVRDTDKMAALYDGFDLSDVTLIKGDLGMDLTAVIDDGVDYIIHTASPTASKFFVEHPVETLGIAIDGTRNVLELARVKQVKGMVYLSSMEAFGNVPSAVGRAAEDDLGYIDIHSVRSSYSEGKRVCELLCSCYAAEYGVNVKIARLAQTFGAGIPYGENRVFAQFAKSVINKQDIVLHTAGKSYGNYVYTMDAVTAILLLLIKGENGEAYTVANEESNITIGDMARLVAHELANDEIEVVFDIPESALTYGYAPDVELHLSSQKLQALGWKPTVGLIDSYKRMMESMLATR